MAYQEINKARFKFLLQFGIDDNELRLFFSGNRGQLIMKGAKVQNLPRGSSNRIAAMLQLPEATDSIVQKWFSTNLTMIEPESVSELIETFKLYEDENEALSESDKKRLSRSCLVHLFSADASENLIDFLKSPISGLGHESDHGTEPDNKSIPQQGQSSDGQLMLNDDLAQALVNLLDRKDPDEHLSNLPPTIASILSGLYYIREGNALEAKNAMDDLSKFELDEVKSTLSHYAERLAKTKVSSRPAVTGIQIIQFEEIEIQEFDFDRDEVVGKCTRDSPETAVFIRPIAIRTWDKRLLSLEDKTIREAVFPSSGDLQAFVGQHYPRQPKRNEIGIWHIARNEPSHTTHFNNFHLRGTKTNVYEVHLVPFVSTDYDSVRGYIEEHFNQSGNNQSEPYLFLLRDNLIVGSPHGKDLTRDDGFDDGLPSWRSLNAFRSEGRLFVLGPLPAHERYECATLASTLKKFFSNKIANSERLTKSQQKCLLDRINSEEGRLNAARYIRLREELEYVENDNSAINILVEEAMKHEKIMSRIEQKVQEKVELQAGKKSELIKELEQLAKQRDDIKKSIAKQEKEHKALPSSVTKAVKNSIKKSKDDVLNTLGQVVVFKALMEDGGDFHNPKNVLSGGLHSNSFSFEEHDPAPFTGVLKSLGISPKHAAAIEIAGETVFNAGMILVLQGVAARLVAKAWGSKDKMGCILMDCDIGFTDDRLIREIKISEGRSIVLLDANLSPIDVFARPLIDYVQCRIIDSEKTKCPKILFSLSDGVASLPLPTNFESVVVRISLDQKLDFIREEDVAFELEEVQDEDAGETWGSRLWRPALESLLVGLKNLPTEDSALVLSVLKGEMPESYLEL